MNHLVAIGTTEQIKANPLGGPTPIIINDINLLISKLKTASVGCRLGITAPVLGAAYLDMDIAITKIKSVAPDLTIREYNSNGITVYVYKNSILVSTAKYGVTGNPISTEYHNQAKLI